MFIRRSRSYTSSQFLARRALSEFTQRDIYARIVLSRCVELLAKYIRDIDSTFIELTISTLYRAVGNVFARLCRGILGEIVFKCSRVCESFNNSNNFPENALTRGNLCYVGALSPLLLQTFPFSSSMHYL